MNNLIGVYGGTFDPFTAGHLQTLYKACKVFDKIYVVISTAEGKKPMFNDAMRRAIAQSSIYRSLWDASNGEPKVEIVMLPKGVYMATFAKKMGAKFLIRGIRDQFDFHYESKINQTNKQIESEIETIYLMPDEKMTLISSSWIKSLVGHNGWRKIVSPYISTFTLEQIALEYARNRFEQMAKHPILALDKNKSWNTELIWDSLYVLPLKRNPYHNIFHILDCLEALDLYYPELQPVMEFAFWMHDVKPSEDDCVVKSVKYLNCATKIVVESVVKCIEATKHKNSNGIYETELEEVFASIDLLCLGREESDYEDYRLKVYAEYKGTMTDDEFKPQWKKGRTEFIDSMLSRKCIYPWKTLRDKFEDNAIRNLHVELNRLNEQK